KSDFTFALGSTEVTPKARAALAAFAHILNNAKILHNEVQILGHTDDVPISPGGPTPPPNPNNRVLSPNRPWSAPATLPPPPAAPAPAPSGTPSPAIPDPIPG